MNKRFFQASLRALPSSQSFEECDRDGYPSYSLGQKLLSPDLENPESRIWYDPDCDCEVRKIKNYLFYLFFHPKTHLLQRIEDVGAEDSIIPEKLVINLSRNEKILFFYTNIISAFKMVSLCRWRGGVSSRLPHWESLRNVHCP